MWALSFGLITRPPHDVQSLSVSVIAMAFSVFYRSVLIALHSSDGTSYKFLNPKDICSLVSVEDFVAILLGKALKWSEWEEARRSRKKASTGNL